MADTEEKRFIDRIRAITFKEARDNGANYITRQWVAERIGRSEEFVKLNWNRDPYDSKMDKVAIGKSGYVMNEHEKRIIRLSSGKQRKSSRKLTQQIATARGDGPCPSRRTIQRYMQSIKMKPFHVIKKPHKSPLQRENRLTFCEHLRLWDENDFLHVVCSDEFFVYICRKPNHQNDRVWATSIDEIEEHERYRQVTAHPICIGIFVCFSVKKLMWVVKENGQTWTGEYFRETILEQAVIPFLKNEDNVLDPEQVTFLHDKAPCFKALATQQLLKDNDIDFFDNSQWPGNSPDLNPCENVGAIIKDKVESALHTFPDNPQQGLLNLQNVLHNVLRNLENDTNLFDSLLRSFPARLAAVTAARGGHTDY